MNTREIFFKIPGYFEDQHKYNLFVVMCNLKEKLDCTFRFKFNCSETNEIAIACHYTDGNILACFVISGKEPKAYPLFVKDTDHKAVFKEQLQQVSSTYPSRNSSKNKSSSTFEEDDILINDILNDCF